MEQVMEALKDPELREKLQKELEEQAAEQEGYEQALKARIPQTIDKLAGTVKRKPNFVVRRAVHEALYRRQ